MEKLQTLSRKIGSAQDMRSVVKTMKALAAVNIREYEKAVDSVRSFAETIEAGLQGLFRNHPSEGGLRFIQRTTRRRGIVVFGSDQGLAGQFNEQIATHVADALGKGAADQERVILAIGERIGGRLENSGMVPDAVVTLPGSTGEVTLHLQDLLFRIEQWRFDRKVDRIDIFHNRPTSGASFQSIGKTILPVRKSWIEDLQQRSWSSRALPMINTSWETMYAELMRQHVFAALYRAFIESLAAENAARLAAMQAAERNISEQLDELQTKFNHQRQTSITAELLDIVAGFEALTKG